MRKYKFNKPLIESANAPTSNDVLWVDVDEKTQKLTSIKEYTNGEWKDIVSGEGNELLKDISILDGDWIWYSRDYPDFKSGITYSELHPDSSETYYCSVYAVFKTSRWYDPEVGGSTIFDILSYALLGKPLVLSDNDLRNAPVLAEMTQGKIPYCIGKPSKISTSADTPYDELETALLRTILPNLVNSLEVDVTSGTWKYEMFTPIFRSAALKIAELNPREMLALLFLVNTIVYVVGDGEHLYCALVFYAD